MNFNEYQKLFKSTTIHDEKHDVLYPNHLDLQKEAGEVANKVKKLIRDVIL